MTVIKRLRYVVELDAGSYQPTAPRGAAVPDPVQLEPAVWQLEVRVVDQTRAELEAPKHGLTNDQPIAMTTVWLWACSRRLGLTDEPFQSFRARVSDFHADPYELELRVDNVDQDGDELRPHELPVPPTPAGASG